MPFKEMPDGTTQYLDENGNLVGEATPEELERWKEHPMHEYVENVVPTHTSTPTSEEKVMTIKERAELLKIEISKQVLRIEEAIKEFGGNTYDEGFQQGILTAMLDEQRFLIQYLEG